MPKKGCCVKVSGGPEGKILTDADIRKMMNNDHTPPASPEARARIAAGVARGWRAAWSLQ